jgi:glycine oxidase
MGVDLGRGQALVAEQLLDDPEIRAALYYANDHQVNALALARALARAAVELGTVLREGSPVDSLMIDRDRVVGVRSGAESIRAEEVVIATGSWSSSWAEALRIAIPVRPVRGQMLALQTAGSSLRNVVFSEAGYLVSKPEGLTYVGATEEEAGFDSRPTAAGIAGLLAVLPRLAPALLSATFAGAWAGLRPATPDRLPILGRVPGFLGVTLATGHFRNGILLAPVTGLLMADLLRLERPRIPLDAFDPARFVMRAA